MGWRQILHCFLIFFSSIPLASPLCPPDQRDALLLFKNSFVLDSKASDICDLHYRKTSYPKTNSWNNAVDCCSWDGVTCASVTGNVIDLDLSCSWLRGTLHSNISLILPKLEGLRLSINRISGEIPMWFWRISDSLERLDLSHNLLEGGIPQLHWKQLLYVNLQNNSFQGPLPILPPSTLYFHVAHNGFIGEIPPSICQLKSLRHLHLTNDSLSGNMPQCFGSLTSLSIIELSKNKFQGPLSILPPSTSSFSAFENNFTGKIPSSICQLSLLKSLYLSHNSLFGNIPPCFGSMTNLSRLSLSKNKFQGPLPILSPSTSYFCASENGFIGEIPSLICQLSLLESLYLSRNSLSGNIPPCLGSMTNLSRLSLARNQFQGLLPVLPPFTFFFDASSNNFTGEIPSSICQLSSLKFLYLFNNSLSGNVLPCFGNITNLLALDLSNNHLTGQWPIEVFSNTSLAVIDLYNNMFGGSIPLPSPITIYYAVARNNITGKIPSLICNATKLEVIDLSGNVLIGSLPRCLTNFSSDLSILKLQQNHLEGTIPQSFSSRNHLVTLDLSQNWFEGILPQSLAECKHLEFLDLSENQIEDTFPSWLGRLLELKVLNLRSNNFKDLLNIPRGAHIFSNLHILDLSKNNFRGPLPTNLLMNLKTMMNEENGKDESLYMIVKGSSYQISETVTMTMKGLEIKLVKILTSLTTIDFSHNSFQGDIPRVFGYLHFLRGLNLSHNQLTGSIPPTLGRLTNLEWLDLSSNKLSGGIPRVLGDLAFLGYLNLSENQLIGRIPQDKHLSTFSSDSFSKNSDLCGLPLQKACPGDAQRPPLSCSSTFNCKGHQSWFEQKIMWMGYASGVVIGISIAYITFKMGRPKWLARGVRIMEIRTAEWMEKPN